MHSAARRCRSGEGSSGKCVSGCEPSGRPAIGRFQALSATQRRLYRAVCRLASRRSGTAKVREVFDRIQPEVIGKAMARSGQLIDRGALAYARRFSIEELNAGTEFYRSPVGTAPFQRRRSMQTARALMEILKQTDPFTAALGTPPQTYYLPNTIRQSERIRRPSRRSSDRSICQPSDTGLLGAVRAAIDLVLSFDAVTDDAAAAMCTSGRHCLDRALETVERHASITLSNDDGFIIVIATDIAFGHRDYPQRDAPTMAKSSVL
jgi:hypothetical protein